MTRSSTSPPRRTSTARSSARPTSAGRSSSEPRSCSRRCASSGARFVQVSTDEVYGDLAGGGSSVETDPIKPSSPYSVAKAAGDLHIPAYARTFGVNASITRGSNTYGPNQYPEKLIPLMTTNAIEGQAAADLRRRKADPRLALGRGSLRRDRDGPARGRSGRGLQRRRPRRARERGGRRPRSSGSLGADESLIRARRGPRGPRPPLFARHEQAARARLGAAEDVRGGDRGDGRLVPWRIGAGGSRSSRASTRRTTRSSTPPGSPAPSVRHFPLRRSSSAPRVAAW